MNIKKLISIIALSFVVLLANSANAVTLGEILNPLEEYLECNDLNAYGKAMCNYLAKEVNKTLNENHLKINSGNFIYSNPQLFSRELLLGDCDSYTPSTMTYLKDGGELKVTLHSDASLVFEGDSVSSPITSMLNLPVSIYSKAKFERFVAFKYDYPSTCGYLPCLKTSCRKTYLDNFYADASANINAQLTVNFSLEPKLLGEDENGNYLVEIAPVFTIVPKLEAHNLEFKVKDIDPLTSGVAAAINAANLPERIAVEAYDVTPTLMLKTAKGDYEYLEDYFNAATAELYGNTGVDALLLIEQFTDVDSLDIDATVWIPIDTSMATILLGVPPTGTFVDVKYIDIDIDTQRELLELVLDYEKKVKKAAREEEIRVREDIQNILGLDSEGKRVYTVPKEVIQNELFFRTGLDTVLGIENIYGNNYIKVTPSSQDFGTVECNASSVATTFEYQNIGLENRTVKSVSFTGKSASEYTVVNDNCTNMTLMPTATCTVNVTFNPALKWSDRTAKLVVDFYDQDTTTVEASLAGKGGESCEGDSTVLVPIFNYMLEENI